MLAILEELSEDIAGASAAAHTRAVALWDRRDEIRALLSLFDAVCLCNNFDDIEMCGDNTSWLASRRRAEDESGEKYRKVRMRCNTIAESGEPMPRDQFYEVAAWDAEMLVKYGSADYADGDEAGEWIDGPEDETAAPSIGEGIRLASLLHG